MSGFGFLDDDLRGLRGVRGFQGISGIGVQGSQGSQGFQGLQGSIGTQGFNGTQGYQGSIGTQGFQGFQGNQGISGLFIESIISNATISLTPALCNAIFNIGGGDTKGVNICGTSNAFNLGKRNIFIGGDRNTFLGDACNCVFIGSNNSVISEKNSVIVGGVSNEIYCPASSILGGARHTIYSTCSNIVICGGNDSFVKTSSVDSCIFGGSYTTINSSSNSHIFGGKCNSITNGAGVCFVGGKFNLSTTTDAGSVIIGGNCNQLTNNAHTNCVILGGVGLSSSQSNEAICQRMRVKESIAITATSVLTTGLCNSSVGNLWVSSASTPANSLMFQSGSGLNSQITPISTLAQTAVSITNTTNFFNMNTMDYIYTRHCGGVRLSGILYRTGSTEKLARCLVASTISTDVEIVQFTPPLRTTNWTSQAEVIGIGAVISSGTNLNQPIKISPVLSASTLITLNINCGGFVLNNDITVSFTIFYQGG
jgi:hypothetical protein